MKRTILSAWAAAAVAGCAVVPGVSGGHGSDGESADSGTAAKSARYSASGKVDFGVAARKVSVSIGDIAAGATVSLIDPESGDTLATTLTKSNGDFVLSFPEEFKPDVGPYFFEAVKGIGASGPNQVGHPTIRVRTLGSFDGVWRSIAAGTVVNLNRSTTALCALAGLKGFTDQQNLQLLGSLSLNQQSSSGGLTNKDTFAGKPGIEVIEFLRAVDLVNQALDHDVDPIAALFLRPTGAASSQLSEAGPGYGMHPGIGWASEGATIAKVSASSATVGQTVSVFGRGFPTGEGLITVKVGSANCAVTPVSSTEFRFTVPEGATGGLVEVRIGRWTLNSGTFLAIVAVVA